MDRIIVCIKGVPLPHTVKVDPETHTLKRESAELILNPNDRSALEMAMRLKENYNCEVVVISMGPPNVVPLLKEAYSLGADQIILLSDRLFAGADTLATSRVLAKAISKLSPFKAVLMGLKSMDGETAQVPPETAALLGIPSVINVKKIFFEENKIVVIRESDYGEEEIEIDPPVVVSITPQLDYYRPPSFKRLLKSKYLEPLIYTAKDLSLPPELLGLKGSPTQVNSLFEKKIVSRGEIWEGAAEELAAKLVKILQEKEFIKE
ncbi:MAG: electron transfer flavoprotein subunit beta/FixA family protein [Thermodesulfobacteriaceae bacterium]|nr:electron transfer flavoprotein subunit beta/FixA family protein [Thermodesulfobacteriaceae bacterium]